MVETGDTLLDEGKAFEAFSRARLAIVVTNPDLTDNPIVYVNDAFTRVTGYARSASIGRNCRFLQGENTSKADVDHLRAGIESEDNVSVDIVNYRANGEPFLNRLTVAPIEDEQGRTRYFVGIQKEIEQSETQASSEQVNTQIMEIQYRVCSDLSMILGMIRQQTGTTAAPEDFAALARRIETLQLLYEEMKLSDRQAERDSIQLGSFLSRLAAAIAHSEGRPGVRLTLQIEPLTVPIETATRVGLALSELMTNAFQHAFDRMDTGLVEIRMSQLSAGGLRLIVSDDGIGIPVEQAWPDPMTVGGRILTGLIEGLEGTLHLGRGAAGSIMTIDVPVGASVQD